MRSIVIMAMFVAGAAQAEWGDYEEVRDLDLDAAGLSGIFIDAGAGSMTVNGDDKAKSIKVTATIQVDAGDDDKARKIIEDRLTLSLERDGDRAVLTSLFDDRMSGDGNASVKLEVTMPTGIPLRIDDGSGSIIVEDTQSDLEIDDGSGSMKIYNVGALDIDDGSGSILVENATGDVTIVDGSGSITVSEVGGSVRIDDGSGSINVSDVEKDLIIEEDGSGSLNVSDVRGSVEADT